MLMNLCCMITSVLARLKGTGILSNCERIVSHKNCSGFKNIGIPIQLFKNTKEETISYCQKMQCRIAEDQLQETNSNANYIFQRGERKHLSQACSMVISGVEQKIAKQKSCKLHSCIT